MNLSSTLSSSLSSIVLRVVAGALVSAIAVGCAAPADGEEVESEVTTADDAVSTQGLSGPTTIGNTPRGARCGDGSVCTETPSNSCGGFRDSCKATAGCGTTSTGAGDIAIVSCIAIPKPPR